MFNKVHVKCGFITTRDRLKGLPQLKQQHLKGVGELDFNFLEFIQLSTGLDALQRTPCIYFASEGKGQGRSWEGPIDTPLTDQHELSSLHARCMVATCVIDNNLAPQGLAMMCTNELHQDCTM